MNRNLQDNTTTLVLRGTSAEGLDADHLADLTGGRSPQADRVVG